MQTVLLIAASALTALGLYRAYLWLRPMERIDYHDGPYAPPPRSRWAPPRRYFDGTFARISKTRTSHLNDDGTYS